jgi:uncharacterized membrane protein (UPF0127 family)
MNRQRGVVLAEAADIADTAAARRKGLLGRDHLTPGEGLWIVPCEGVHTFGMRFPIDVVFLSKRRKVLKIVHAMPRRRIALSLLAHSVLELPAGVVRESGTTRGDELDLDEYDPPAP